MTFKKGLLKFLWYNVDMKNKIYRVCENISLGLFVNSSYGLTQGDLGISNIYLALISIYAMTSFILSQED